MSCNGCRVLRKGCSDSCILRPCLQWIESPEPQGHATVFVAKFFGRAGMMSFISAVSESQRPALFQSLLYEACGRTVNPVFGAVGLLWSGNWAMCQAAVETVLKGGCLKPMSSCVSPSASAKPLHPNSSKRSGPLLTTTTNLTKRSRGMMEANSKIDPDSKRLRSLDQLEDTMTPMGQPEQNVFVMNKPVVYARQEERPALPPPSGPPSPSGQLVAPVPRRVRPQMGCFGVAAMVMRDAQLQQAAQQEQQQQGGQRQACEEQERQSHDESVELDLTLNSHAKLGSPACVMRASSPSSFSINSEGSVISSDSAEFSACGMRTVSPQFLHLL